jgi:hypothetical protein
VSDVDRLRAARYLLVEDAEFCREGRENFRPLSHLEWLDRASDSEAGQLVGAREIEAIASMTFGRKRGRPTRGTSIG